MQSNARRAHPRLSQADSDTQTVYSLSAEDIKRDERNLEVRWLIKQKRVSGGGQGKVITWEMSRGAPRLPMSPRRWER